MTGSLVSKPSPMRSAFSRSSSKSWGRQANRCPSMDTGPIMLDRPSHHATLPNTEFRILNGREHDPVGAAAEPDRSGLWADIGSDHRPHAAAGAADPAERT